MGDEEEGRGRKMWEKVRNNRRLRFFGGWKGEGVLIHIFFYEGQ